MNIYMWSGPRNLSTALMRSFENREDTEVWDEPLYAYYLNETKKNHPMKDDIIKNYPTDINKIIKLMSTEPHNNKICYQKHNYCNNCIYIFLNETKSLYLNGTDDRDCDHRHPICRWDGYVWRPI